MTDEQFYEIGAAIGHLTRALAAAGLEPPTAIHVGHESYDALRGHPQASNNLVVADRSNVSGERMEFAGVRINR